MSTERRNSHFTMQNIRNRSKAERFFLWLSTLFLLLKNRIKNENITKMENWAEEINSKIDTRLEKSRDKDVRFFRVDEFKRNIIRVSEFSGSCSHCQKIKIDISETVETINEAIEVPGSSRRDYDRLISRLARHMQKEHGFYAPFYFSYLYAFIGIVAGLVTGYVLFKAVPVYGEALFLACVMVGIVTAYIAGSLKDSKIRTTKKIM